MINRLLSILICILFLLAIGTYKQENVESSPTQLHIQPIAERISVAQSEDYMVMVIGEANSVYPSIHIAIRNLYTRDTTIVKSNFDGSFSANLQGLENMPYLVAYIENIPAIPSIPPLDGIGTIISPNVIEEQNISIGLGGWVSYGWVRWLADTSINQTHIRQGDNLSVSMQVTFFDAFRLLSLTGSVTNYDYQMRGQLGLYPIANEDGNSLSNEIGVSEDGSFEFLSNDLPNLENAILEIFIAETDDIGIIDNDMVFTLDFETSLSDEIISGTYMLVFTGEIKVDDNNFELWYESHHFAIDGTNGITLMATARPNPIILPIVITVDGINNSDD